MSNRNPSASGHRAHPYSRPIPTNGQQRYNSNDDEEERDNTETGLIGTLTNIIMKPLKWVFQNNVDYNTEKTGNTPAKQMISSSSSSPASTSSHHKSTIRTPQVLKGGIVNTSSRHANIDNNNLDEYDDTLSKVKQPELPSNIDTSTLKFKDNPKSLNGSNGSSSRSKSKSPIVNNYNLEKVLKKPTLTSPIPQQQSNQNNNNNQYINGYSRSNNNNSVYNSSIYRKISPSSTSSLMSSITTSPENQFISPRSTFQTGLDLPNNLISSGFKLGKRQNEQQEDFNSFYRKKILSGPNGELNDSFNDENQPPLKKRGAINSSIVLGNNSQLLNSNINRQMNADGSRISINPSIIASTSEAAKRILEHLDTFSSPYSSTLSNSTYQSIKNDTYKPRISQFIPSHKYAPYGSVSKLMEKKPKSDKEREREKQFIPSSSIPYSAVSQYKKPATTTKKVSFEQGSTDEHDDIDTGKLPNGTHNIKNSNIDTSFNPFASVKPVSTTSESSSSSLFNINDKPSSKPTTNGFSSSTFAPAASTLTLSAFGPSKDKEEKSSKPKATPYGDKKRTHHDDEDVDDSLYIDPALEKVTSIDTSTIKPISLPTNFGDTLKTTPFTTTTAANTIKSSLFGTISTTPLTTELNNKPASIIPPTTVNNEKKETTTTSIIPEKKTETEKEKPSLFGGLSATSTLPTTSSLFGNTTAPLTVNSVSVTTASTLPATSSLFGNTNSLFGASSTTTTPAATSEKKNESDKPKATTTVNPPSLFGNTTSLFGAASTSATGSLFGNSLLSTAPSTSIQLPSTKPASSKKQPEVVELDDDEEEKGEEDDEEGEGADDGFTEEENFYVPSDEEEEEKEEAKPVFTPIMFGNVGSGSLSLFGGTSTAGSASNGAGSLFSLSKPATATSTDTSAPKSLFGFSSVTPAVDTTKKDSPPATTTLFGAVSQPSSSTQSIFSTSPPTSSGDSKKEEEKPATNLFSFGTTPIPAASTSLFGSSNTSSLFSAKPSTDDKDKKSPPTSLFGSATTPVSTESKPSSPPAATSSLFGQATANLFGPSSTTTAPAISTAPISIAGASNATTSAALVGPWKCPCCETANEEKDKSCPVCMVKRAPPKATPAATENPASTTSGNTTFPSSFGSSTTFSSSLFGGSSSDKDDKPKISFGTSSSTSLFGASSDKPLTAVPLTGGANIFGSSSTSTTNTTFPSSFGGSSTTSNTTFPSSFGGSSASAALPDGKWKCPCCETVNEDKDKSCTVCMVKRAPVKPTPAATDKPAAGITFGSAPSTSSLFGGSLDKDKPATTSSSLFGTTSSTTPSVSALPTTSSLFGGSLDNNKDKPASSSLFGASTSLTSTTTPSSSPPLQSTSLFGASKPEEEKKSLFGTMTSTTTPSTSLFNNTLTTPVSSSSTTTPSVSTLPTTSSLFGSTPATTIASAAITTATPFGATPSTSLFGPSSTTTPASAPATTPASSGLFSFGSSATVPTTTPPTSATSPTFSTTPSVNPFSSSAATPFGSSTLGSSTTTPSINTFGSSTLGTSSTSNPFGGTSLTNPSSNPFAGSSLGTSSTSNPFGGPSLASSTSTPPGGMFAFGSSSNNNSSSTNTSSPTFGSQTFGQTPPTSTTPNLFGGASSSNPQPFGQPSAAPTSTTPNLFGGAPSSNPPFGAPFGAPATSTPPFGAPATSTPPFGSTPFGQQPNPNPFGGNPSSVNPFAASPFGQPAAASGAPFAFGQQSTPTLGFGGGLNTSASSLPSNGNGFSIGSKPTQKKKRG